MVSLLKLSWVSILGLKSLHPPGRIRFLVDKEEGCTCFTGGLVKKGMMEKCFVRGI